MTNNTSNENIGLLEVIVKYLRCWKVFLATFILSVIVAVLYLTFCLETYRGETRMQLLSDQSMGPGNLGDLGIMKSLGMGGSIGGINMDDEKQILRSQSILQNLAFELGLNVSYAYPALLSYNMYSQNPVIIKADSTTFANMPREVKLKAQIAPGKIEVISKIAGYEKEKYSFSALPAVIKTPFGEFTLDYSEKVAPPESFTINIMIEPLSWAAENLYKKLSIDSDTKNSEIMTLEYQDYELQRIKDVLNTLVVVYNKHSDKIKRSTASNSLAFFDERIAIVYDELKKSEQSIESYKSRHNYTELDADIRLYSTQLSEIQNNIIGAETELYRIELLEEYIKDPQNKHELAPSLFSSNSGVGNVLITQYNELMLERNRVLEQTHENSAIILTYDKQLESLKKSIISTVKNANESQRQSLKNLKSKENALLGKIGGVPTYEKVFTDSKRQQEILQSVYLYLIQKREEIALSIGEEKDKGRSLYPTYIKKQRVAPRKLYAAIGIMAFTLIFSVGFIFGKELYVALKKGLKATENKG